MATPSMVSAATMILLKNCSTITPSCCLAMRLRVLDVPINWLISVGCGTRCSAEKTCSGRPLHASFSEVVFGGCVGVPLLGNLGHGLPSVGHKREDARLLVRRLHIGGAHCHAPRPNCAYNDISKKSTGELESLSRKKAARQGRCCMSGLRSPDPGTDAKPDLSYRTNITPRANLSLSMNVCLQPQANGDLQRDCPPLFVATTLIVGPRPWCRTARLHSHAA
jgi:hypothetical protein